jgi:hypothetical protein
MNYLLLIAGDHETTPEELAAMQREIPGWIQEMDGRGVRPFRDRRRLGEKASAFAGMDDSAGRPYLLIMWVGKEPAADQAVLDESSAWRQDVAARDLHVPGRRP